MKKRLLLVILFFASFIVVAQKFSASTPRQVVEQIKQHLTCDWMSETVDVFKTGDHESELKGIAVCMFADMPTLQKAVEMNCNFIITHEPIFYNHFDDTKDLKDDPVFLQKMEYIQNHDLVVFRFHDHIHMTNPDGIYAGMIDQLNLQSFSSDKSLVHYQLPEQSVKDYAAELKQKLELETVRVIGDPEMKFTKMALMVGAPGGQRHIKMLSDPNVEVLVAGEATEWETYLYANDAKALGMNKAVIFLGHVKSEEAGMKHCADWLKGFISGVPINFIENQPNFSTL